MLASGVAYEVRTTVHPALLDDDALVRMADELAEMGVGSWVLQPFRVEGCADEGLVAQPPAALRLSPELAAHALPVSIRS